jgi:CRP-like cAMP-binding protein
MYEKWVKALAISPLFKGMNTDELKGVLACLKPTVGSYERNEMLAVEGEKMTGLGVVLSGDVVVSKENTAGNRVIIAVDGPGEMFGEMAAFSGSVVWTATVMARGACEVMFLPSGKIVSSCENACASHKLMISNMLKIISNKALALHRKVEYLAIKSMRGKISTYLLEQYKRMGGKATFIIPLKRNELADFLNVSRPSLSREMSRLMDEGVIDYHRASIKIRDLESLKKMAE